MFIYFFIKDLFLCLHNKKDILAATSVVSSNHNLSRIAAAIAMNRGR